MSQLVRFGLWVGVVGAVLATAGCQSKSSDAPATVADQKKAEAAASAQPTPSPEDPRAAGLGHGDAPKRGAASDGVAGEKGRAPSMATAPPPPPQTIIPGAGAMGSQGNGGLLPQQSSPAPALVPIDPNGRFATTYRPGGGHLAAFESAVSRGILPTADRELVSDVGARYTPAMDAPKTTSMAMRADLERGKLAPSGGPFHVRIGLRSTTEKPADRPHLSVHLVLDVSGSMAGESITRAREAARLLVDKLAPTDDFSLVTFSSDAEVKVPDGPVGSRKDAIKKTIEGVHEGGGTNIGKGLTLGYEQASAKTIPDDAVRVVLLVSDGRVNAGIMGTDKVSHLALEAFQKGIQTSAFGLGADYDGELMSAVASDGAGGYYYLRDAEQIAPALATEIDKRLDPVATAVEVRIRLKKGVELLKVYGSRRLDQVEAAKVRAQEVAADDQAKKQSKIDKDRQDDVEGGMRFFIPAFAPDDAHALLLQLRVPEGAGTKQVAMVEIKYKDRVHKKNVSDELPIAIGYADSDAASAATIDSSVSRTAQGFAAGESLAEAAARIAANDRPRAVAILSEREGILRQAAETLKEPLFLKDADRLARLREYGGKESGAGDPLVLAMLLETASRTHLH